MNTKSGITLALVLAGTGLVSACVGYVPGGPDYRNDDRGGYHERGHDRDRDGIPNGGDRDRDGDGVPNRDDSRPNNPNRN